MYRIIEYHFYLFFSKILLELVYCRLICFVIRNIILMEAQNGFREKKLTGTAIHSFIESTQDVLDRGLHAVGIFFYLTKAFDVVWFAMGPLRFFIDKPCGCTMALGLTQLLTERGTIDLPCGSWCIGLTTLPPLCASCPKFLEASTSWRPRDLSRPVYRDSITFTWCHNSWHIIGSTGFLWNMG